MGTNHQIICGRSEQVLAGWPEGCVDLIVTSPPYDLIRTYGGIIQKPTDFPFEAMALQLARVLKPGGALVWIVGDSTDDEGSETLTSSYQKIFFREKAGLLIHDTMIYEKSGPAFPSADKYFQVWEYMFVFKKGKKLNTFDPIKDRKNRWYKQKFSKIRTRRDQNGDLRAMTWDGEEGGQYGKRYNIWKYSTGAGYSTKDDFAFGHPATFPEALARDHILSWSNPGDLVLDPMCGSGTTLKMAILHGRPCIGIDISPEYCREIARRRVQVAYEELGFLGLDMVQVEKPEEPVDEPEGKTFLDMIEAKPEPADKKVCWVCNGSGGKGPHKCPECDGRGYDPKRPGPPKHED